MKNFELNGNSAASSTIIAQDSKVVHRFEKIKAYFLTGGRLRANQVKDKIEYTEKYRSLCKGNKNWSVVESLEEIRKNIDLGYAHQLSLSKSKTGVNREIEFATISDIAFIDIDNIDKNTDKPHDNAVTLQQVLECEIVQKYINFYQLSFTQKSEEFPNIHLYLIFNESISTSDRALFLKIFVLALREELKIKNGIIDACIANNPVQVCFPGKTHTITVNENNLVNISEFILDYPDFEEEVLRELDKKKMTKKEKIKNYSSTNNLPPSESSNNQDNNTIDSGQDKKEVKSELSLLEHIKSEIIDNILEGDWEKIYNILYDHKFTHRSEIQLEGLNPFSTTNNSSTGSFTVTLEDENLPPIWYSRCGVSDDISDDINNSGGGDFISYWLLSHRLLPKIGRVNPYAKFELKRQYIESYKDICKHFKVKPLDLRKKKDFSASINSIMELVCEELKEVLYIVEWGKENEDVIRRFYYMNGTKIFSVYCAKKLSLKLAEYIKKTHPDFEEKIFARLAADSKFKWKGLSNEINSWLNSNESTLKPLTSKPNWNHRYIPFLNGLYDTQEKVLIDNDGRAFNNKIADCDFKFISDENPGVLAFKKWIKNWMRKDVKYDYLMAYTTALMQGRVNEIKSFPCIYGDRGTGKSSFGSTLISIFPESLELALPNSKQPLNSRNNHASAMLEGKFIFTIKEIGQTDSCDLNALLELFGEDNPTESIGINPKGEGVRIVPRLFGLVTDSELIPQLPKSKSGFYRRFAFLESFFYAEAKGLIEIVRKHSDDVFCWFLQQDFDKAKEVILNCEKDEIFIHQSLKVQKENSELAQFIDDCMDMDKVSEVSEVNEANEVSEVSEESHNSDDIFRLYMQWCAKNNEKPLSNRIFSKHFKVALKIFGWSDSKYCRSNGKSKYSGIKFRDSVKNYNLISGLSNF